MFRRNLQKYPASKSTRRRPTANWWKETDSRECRNCHNLDYMDFTVQEKCSRKRHAVAIEKDKTCIDCHKGIAHELPKGAFEAEKETSGGGRGCGAWFVTRLPPLLTMKEI
jgi:cytochrome c-type protein NapC